MAAPTKQITAYTCMLAALESLSIDRGQPVTQPGLIAQFPVWCRQGHPEEGAIDILVFQHILVALGFASSMKSGIGQAFITAHQGSVADGMFILTINHPNGVYGGYHCWRVHAIHAQSVVVVEPSPQIAAPYSQLTWAQITLLGGVAYVCVP